MGLIARLGIKPKIPGEYGLPKPAVEQVSITVTGADGDYNNYRMRDLDGDPDQAILLMTTEVLRQLNAEGWPVQPGDVGENITLDQIPEASLVPGAVLTLGPVRLEVTKPCVPCRELYSLPCIGAEKGPAFLKSALGRRGWYARVLTAGVLRTGMPVQLDATVRA